MHRFIESTEIVNNNYKVSVSVFQKLSVMGKYTKVTLWKAQVRTFPVKVVNHVPEACSDQLRHTAVAGTVLRC